MVCISMVCWGVVQRVATDAGKRLGCNGAVTDGCTLPEEPAVQANICSLPCSLHPLPCPASRNRPLPTAPAQPPNSHVPPHLHALQRVLPACVRLGQVLCRFAQSLVAHLHWQAVVQVQQAHLHSQLLIRQGRLVLDVELFMRRLMRALALSRHASAAVRSLQPPLAPPVALARCSQAARPPTWHTFLALATSWQMMVFL